MKCLTRYCSLLLCFVLLFLVYCAPVSAETLDVAPYTVKHHLTVWGSSPLSESVISTPMNGTIEKKSGTHTINNSSNEVIEFTYYIEITPKENVIVKKGNNATITIGNIYYKDEYIINGGTYHSTNYDDLIVKLYLKNGDVVNVTSNTTPTKNVDEYTLTIDYEPPSDVVGLQITFEDSITAKTSPIKFNYKLGEYIGDNSFTLQVEQTSETNGLLGSIIEWLKGIKDGITNGLSNVVNGVTNVFNSIKELPSKLWNLIQEGLKNLFVPSDEYFETLSNKWDTLLYDRFGALYESVEFIIFFFEDLLDFNGLAMKEYFDLPIVSLASCGIPFEFGGYTVRFIPNGFEFLVDVVKMITSFVVSILFFNALRKRYDEVMGVEE